MANLKTVLLTSVLSVLVASNVMAAPQDHHETKDKRQHSSQHQRGDHKDHKQGNASSQHAKNTHEAQHKRGQATSQWKAGNKLPEKYHSHNFKVTPNAHKLPQPGKNQRWIKVDRHYILENVLTHTIVKVISA